MEIDNKQSEEEQRLNALYQTKALPDGIGENLDKILRLSTMALKLPYAGVSFVDAETEWIQSSLSSRLFEVSRKESIGGEVVQKKEILQVEDLSKDSLFKKNQFLSRYEDIKSFLSAPIILEGFYYVGTLSVFDVEVRRFTDEEAQILQDLAACVVSELNSNRLLDLSSDGMRLATVEENTDNAVIITDSHGDIEWVNHCVEEIMQQHNRDIVGKSIDSILNNKDVATAVGKMIKLGQAFESDFKYREQDSSARWLNINLQPIRERGELANFVVTLRDISAKRTAERRLVSSEKKISAIVETVIDGIITIDSKGTVQTFNPAAARLFGYEPDEIIGKNVKVLMPSPYSENHDGYIKNYIDTGEKKIIGLGREVVGRRKDGSTFDIDLAISEMVIEGEKMFTGVVRDITERKKLEHMKKEFVATVSHELRTPLTSIRGAVGLVLGKYSDQLAEKPRKLLATAERNGERLTTLINDLLDLEKLESGNMKISRKILDLVQLTQRAVNDNEGFASSKNIKLKIINPISKAMVFADEQRLLQVYANLISNAVKFSPEGSEVKIEIVSVENYFQVAVQDEGPGISEDFRKRIFQRFAQEDGSDSREKGGTGLGLSITKTIVELHDGSMDYETEIGEGTTFRFSIPCYEINKDPELKKVDALICEDNQDVAQVIANMLELENITSDIAVTASDASKLLSHTRYSILLTDLTLPDKDGLEFIRELREAENTKGLPIIVVSGRAELERDAEHIEALQVLEWIQKPFDPTYFSTLVRQVVETTALPKILHVEDDPDIVQVSRTLLEEIAEVEHALTLKEAISRVSTSKYDLIILDVGLSDGSGLNLLDQLNSSIPIIIFSGREVEEGISQQVEACLTKTLTSYEQLIQTVN